MPTTPKPKRPRPSATRDVGAALVVLGQQLRTQRLKLKLTFEQAEEATGVDWKHIQKIETGVLNLTVGTLVRLADGYGVAVATLTRSLNARSTSSRSPQAPRGRAPARSRKR